MEGGKVASSEWSSPPSSASPGEIPSSTLLKSSPTPLARASRAASIASPSLRSSIAVAPARAAAGPSAIGGRGRELRGGLVAQPGRERRQTARPRHPPRTGTTAAARSQTPRAHRTRRRRPRPARRTAAPHPARRGRRRPSRRSSASARPRGRRRRCRSPARARRRHRESRRRCPRAARPASRAGAAIATTSAVGTAPIAATSARLDAAAFQPRSCGVDQASRKSGPWIIMSVVTTKRPSGAATTAASSPGPSRADAAAGSRGKIRARTADSPVAPSVSELSELPKPPGPVSICHASNASLKAMNPRLTRIAPIALLPLLLALLSACAPTVRALPGGQRDQSEVRGCHRAPAGLSGRPGS